MVSHYLGNNLSVIESVSVPYFKWQDLAMKPYIKYYVWGFLKKGKGTRFFLGFSRIRPGQRGIKAEFKQEKENPVHSGRAKHIHLGHKARHFKEWGSKTGACKYQIGLYSLNFETCDQMPVMMRLGESDSEGPVSPLHLGRAASWERLEQGSCGGGTAAWVSLGRGR